MMKVIQQMWVPYGRFKSRDMRDEISIFCPVLRNLFNLLHVNSLNFFEYFSKSILVIISMFAHNNRICSHKTISHNFVLSIVTDGFTKCTAVATKTQRCIIVTFFGLRLISVRKTCSWGSVSPMDTQDSMTLQVSSCVQVFRISASVLRSAALHKRDNNCNLSLKNYFVNS